MLNKTLPEVKKQYLVDVLFNVGPVIFYGDRPNSISFQEISSFSQNCNFLNSWEMQTIKTLSKTYVKQYFKSLNENCVPPWGVDTTSGKIDSGDLRKAVSKFGKVKRVKRK